MCLGTSSKPWVVPVPEMYEVRRYGEVVFSSDSFTTAWEMYRLERVTWPASSFHTQTQEDV